MTAIEFVEKINSTQLSSDELKGIGGEGFIDIVKKTGTIPKLEKEFIEYGNEILNLVLNYNVSIFEVINITFDEDLYEVDDDIFLVGMLMVIDWVLINIPKRFLHIILMLIKFQVTVLQMIKHF